VHDLSNDLSDCIFPNVPRKLTQPSPGSRPGVHYRVRIDTNSGGLFGITLIKSSGIEGFDQAVYEGIRKCVPFPKPATGYPSVMDISYGL
jgi:colicin import membrane protein